MYQFNQLKLQQNCRVFFSEAQKHTFAFVSHLIKQSVLVARQFNAVETAHADEHVDNVVLGLQAKSLHHLVFVNPLESAILHVDARNYLVKLEALALLHIRVIVHILAALRLEKQAQDGACAGVDDVIVEKVNNLRRARVRRHHVLRSCLTRRVQDFTHEAA